MQVSGDYDRVRQGPIRVSQRPIKSSSNWTLDVIRREFRVGLDRTFFLFSWRRSSDLAMMGSFWERRNERGWHGVGGWERRNDRCC